MTISAIPMEYGGITFRSTLEANWARTLDTWGWAWSYEPIALNIDGTPYPPDFYVANQNLWLEVKGPHDERIDKPGRLQRAMEDDEMNIRKPLVVILRAPGRGDMAVWEGAVPGTEVVLSQCPECPYETFIDLNGIWVCRQCWRGQGLKDKGRRWITNYRTAGEIPFWRAPRPA